jgi:hypothetical protein
VAEVARRHGLNANLIFKWIRRARDGWVDGRRMLAGRRTPESVGSLGFVPITIESAPLQLPSPSTPISEAVAPAPSVTKKRKVPKRRGVIEIALPGGARISTSKCKALWRNPRTLLITTQYGKVRVAVQRYGVYDIGANSGCVSVGIDYDTEV